jgi:hypothetical protein
MRRQIWLFALFIAACSSPPAPDTAELTPASNTDVTTPTGNSDPALYQEYAWPEDWPIASDDNGEEMHGARVAARAGRRQVVVADSASALVGHERQLRQTVLVLGSHCGRNVALLVNQTRPLGAIGHDAGIGRHAAGIQCVSFGDEIDLPTATVSADSAYIGVGMSIWTTGVISAANKSAKAMGIRAGMSTQEATSIMLAKAQTPPEPD